MKCDCYDWRYDPLGRALVAGVIASAFEGDTYLVFEKKEWIPDNGFLFHNKEVYVPRGYDGNDAKIACYRKCLNLMSDGYSNEIAERNKEKMESYLVGLDVKE